MDINVSAQTRNVSFTISGRSDGGTAKTSHLMKAYEKYVEHFGSKNVLVIIYLADGIYPINKATAKAVIRGYKQAAKQLEAFAHNQGNTNFSMNLQFIKAF